MAATLADSPRCFDAIQLREFISEGSLDFGEWTSLISHVEKIYPDDMEKICLTYENFLSDFPLCHGYWRKYVAHMARLSTADKVVEVFEKAVLAATYSVGIWVDYCCFSMSAFEDPSDVRRLFKRAVSFVGKDYLCHTLWDKYIQFEFSQQQWVSLAHIYIQTLGFPTKKLHKYYDSFKKLLTLLEGGIASLNSSPKELQSEPSFYGEIPIHCKHDKIYCIIKDMMDSSSGLTRSIALKKYRIIGEQLYQRAHELDLKISPFEANIQRNYFHVQPLDNSQLQNWHDYLDFIELQEDFDWAVKLYERCLIVCANYPEYWMRYVEFMETKGGREIANYSLDRATGIYLKRVPEIHLFNARFKEQIGDVLAARAAYIKQTGNESDSDFAQNVISRANMEKRLGNMESACGIYKEAIEMIVDEEKLQDALPILYVHFCHLKYMSTNNVDAARDILVDGIKNLPQNKQLLEELIKFSMDHGGSMSMAVIDSIIAEAISPRADGSHGLGVEDAEDISHLYLKFVDYCGTIHDLRKAWNRHRKLFRASSRTETHQQSTKRRRSLNLIQDRREETSIDMCNQPSKDSSTDLQASLHTHEEKMLSQKYPLPDAEEPRNNDPKNMLSADLVEVKQEPAEVAKHSKPNSYESDVSSETLFHQTASGNQPPQALQASPKEVDDYSQGKCEVGREELKPLSQKSMSPKSPERIHDSGSMVSWDEGYTTGVVVGGCTGQQDNPVSTQVSLSAQTCIELDNDSYSASHQDHRARRPFLPPRLSRNPGRNLHQMKNAGKFRKGPKNGDRGYMHRKHLERQQPSLQQMHPAEGGAQLPLQPGYSSQSVLQIQHCNQGQNQFQSTVTAAYNWPLQNSSSQSQPSPNAPSQVLHSMQGNGQYGYMQNNQEYNQMWQYYYYQQQQQLQVQQHYLQLQQQSFQQEQSQQQTSQLGHLQPQHLQQLQFQLQQQVLQQQQDHHPVHMQPLQPSAQSQSSSNPVAEQGLAMVTSQSQDHGSTPSEQACKPGVVSSPVPPHSEEKSIPEEL
ncbi:hypothetical protein PIB30_004662 [Stylosanthes scabra]|uniref:Pre-mRNA-processing factor 39 n=1 Tax=Stylosanthes scabra TaxID=79078 RepID=A0ABU6Q4J7_9FABA|nr:hypothetical protein [Stylosanthes scabra]